MVSTNREAWAAVEAWYPALGAAPRCAVPIPGCRLTTGAGIVPFSEPPHQTLIVWGRQRPWMRLEPARGECGEGSGKSTGVYLSASLASRAWRWH